MSENEYLDKSEFRSFDHCSSYKMYNIGYRGRAWLHANGEKAKLSGFLANCDTAHIKKILSANQCMVKLGLLLEYRYDTCKIITDNSYGGTDNIFRAYGFARNDESAIIIETVRKEKNYIEKFIVKYERMLKTLNCKNVNLRVSKLDIIYVAEDKDMMIELMEEIIKMKGICEMNVWFTYDRILMESHSNKLYAINMDKVV